MKLFLAFIIAFTSSFGFGATKTTIKADIVEGIVSVQELIGAKGHFEKNAIGWNGFDDGAATSPVDGTGGATITTTCTRTTSSPIDGDGSLLITKLGANYQGEGCSLDFTIPAHLSGTVLRGSFDYAISSGTYTDDAVQVWLYNVTDGALVQPAPTKIKNHSLNKQVYDFEFQPTYGTSSKTWRVILHIAASDTNAYTIKIDNWKLGAYPKNYGSPVTDWVSYTPTLTNGTNATATGMWRRVGDSIDLQIRIAWSGAGSGGDIAASTPSGITLDSNKVPADTSYGAGWFYRGASGFEATTSRSGGTSSVVFIRSLVNDNINGSDGASGYIISARALLPVSGWSSSQVMSSDADTRVVAAQMTSSDTPTFATGTPTKATWSTTVTDSNSMADLTNDRFNILVPGDYRFSANYFFNSIASTANGSIQMSARVNGTTTYIMGAQGYASGVTQYRGFAGTTIIRNLKAGDYVELVISQDIVATLTALNSLNHFDVERISGQSQITASETVAAKYSSAAASTLNGSVIKDYATKIWDTHGAVTTGASWKFTAPISGKYSVNAKLETASLAWTAGQQVNIVLFKNGSQYESIHRLTIQASGTQVYYLDGALDVNLLAGEYIDVRSDSSVAGNTGSTAANQTISITRTGNY